MKSKQEIESRMSELTEEINKLRDEYFNNFHQEKINTLKSFVGKCFEYNNKNLNYKRYILYTGVNEEKLTLDAVCLDKSNYNKLQVSLSNHEGFDRGDAIKRNELKEISRQEFDNVVLESINELNKIINQ